MEATSPGSQSTAMPLPESPVRAAPRRRLWLALGGVAVLGVAGLAGALLYGRGQRGMPVSQAARSFRVPDAAMIIQVAPGRFLASKWFQRGLSEIGRRPGIPEGFRKTAANAAGSSDSPLPRIAFIEASSALRADSAMIVVETRAAISVAEWDDFVTRWGPYEKMRPEETHAGIEIHRWKERRQGKRDLFAAFPTDRLAVLGSLPELRQGLDNFRTGRAATINPRTARLLASVPPKACLAAAGYLANKEADPTDIVQVVPVPTSIKGLESVLLTVTADRTAVIRQHNQLESVEQAEQARQQIKEQITSLLGSLTKDGSASRVKDSLSGMTSGGSGRECWFRWELPDTIIADVVEGLCAAFWPNSKPGSPADTGVQR